MLHLNLQQRVDAIAGAAARHQSARPVLQWESDAVMDVAVTTGGTWNAVAFWFEVQMHGTSCVSSWEGGRPGLPVCSSWGQAVQYLDHRKVFQGKQVKLRVQQDSCQNSVQLSSSTAASPPCFCAQVAL